MASAQMWLDHGASEGARGMWFVYAHTLRGLAPKGLAGGTQVSFMCNSGVAQQWVNRAERSGSSSALHSFAGHWHGLALLGAAVVWGICSVWLCLEVDRAVMGCRSALHDLEMG